MNKIYNTIYNTCIALSISLSHPKRLSWMTPVNLVGTNFSIVAVDAFKSLKLGVDKSTFLHNIGSEATVLHLWQTIDILKWQKTIICTIFSLCIYPDLSNQTKPNKKPIEPNRTPIVRLGSTIKQNQTPILLWSVPFSNQSNQYNRTKSN